MYLCLVPCLPNALLLWQLNALYNAIPHAYSMPLFPFGNVAFLLQMCTTEFIILLINIWGWPHQIRIVFFGLFWDIKGMQEFVSCMWKQIPPDLSWSKKPPLNLTRNSNFLQVVALNCTLLSGRQARALSQVVLFLLIKSLNVTVCRPSSAPSLFHSFERKLTIFSIRHSHRWPLPPSIA